MKTRIQVTIFALISAMMVTGIVYGYDPLTGPGAGSTEGTGLGWQEQTSRQPVYITDGFRLNTGVGVGLTGPNVNISISSTITRIECCMPTTLKQSWCNFNADDERCNN